MIILLKKNGLDRGAWCYNIFAQDPYSYKTGSCERGQVLLSIADVFNSTQQPHMGSIIPSIRDHLNSLLSKLKSKKKTLKAGGIEVETTEWSLVLEEFLSAKTEYIRFSI